MPRGSHLIPFQDWMKFGIMMMMKIMLKNKTRVRLKLRIQLQSEQWYMYNEYTYYIYRSSFWLLWHLSHSHSPPPLPSTCKWQDYNIISCIACLTLLNTYVHMCLSSSLAINNMVFLRLKSHNFWGSTHVIWGLKHDILRLKPCNSESQTSHFETQTI